MVHLAAPDPGPPGERAAFVHTSIGALLTLLEATAAWCVPHGQGQRHPEPTVRRLPTGLDGVAMMDRDLRDCVARRARLPDALS